jgi:hypothetical protein
MHPGGGATLRPPPATRHKNQGRCQGLPR